MGEPEWSPAWLAVRIHDEQLADHGGLPGFRDDGALRSALARPVDLFLYGHPDLPALAGAYADGIARNHPFIDGNKRTSFVATLTFLMLNGLRINATDPDEIGLWRRQRARAV